MKIRMTVGKKLVGMSAISTLLMIGVAVVGYWGIETISGATGKMLREDAKIAEHAARVRANVLGLRRYEKDMFINIQDQKKVEEYEKKFQDQQEHLSQRIAALTAVVGRAQDRERVGQMTKDLQAYRTGMAEIVAQIKAGGLKTTVDSNKAVGRHKDEIHRLEKNGEELSKEAYARMAEVEGVLTAQAQKTLWFMGAFSLFAVAGGVLLSGLLSRSITAPLKRMADMLKDIAEGEGDLTKRVQINTSDEVGDTAHWFNTLIGKIHDIMVQVRAAAGDAAVASQQLSAATSQLSTAAQEQASALEETAASLEEITGTVKQNADNARQASQLAVGSRDVAEKGGQVVREAVTSMTEINKSSKKIADIITTIDEIAFQTNLLALNAAVEAARAGEQGRGFAVVAAEVRNLAQRSATAAKEIKGLIQDSVQKVETGSELVNRSGETLTEIVGSVKRVTDIIAEIAAASQEQTTGIDQVNKAVTQMDQVTQSNAAQTEELSSTAQSLAAQAEQLQALVARFKLNEHTAPARKTAPAAAPRSTTPAPIAKFVAKAKTKREELVLAGARPDHRPASRNGSAHAEDDGFEEF